MRGRPSGQSVTTPFLGAVVEAVVRVEAPRPVRGVLDGLRRELGLERDQERGGTDEGEAEAEEELGNHFLEAGGYEGYVVISSNSSGLTATTPVAASC